MAAKGPKNRSRQAKPETPEKRRYPLRKAPEVYSSQRPLTLLHLLLPRGSQAASDLSFPSFAGDLASGHSGHLTGGNPAQPQPAGMVAVVDIPDATTNRNDASLAL